MSAKLLAGIFVVTNLILSGIASGDWTVNVHPGPIFGSVGSSIFVQCSYDYPEDSESGKPNRVFSEMWCLNQSLCITPRYIYHSAGLFPEPSYLGRIKYFGQTGSKNCSLQISDLRLEDSGVYVFRFITDHTKAKLPGQRGVRLEVTHHTKGGTKNGSSSTIGIVFGVILITIVIIACVITCIRHKSRNGRSRPL